MALAAGLLRRVRAAKTDDFFSGSDNEQDELVDASQDSDMSDQGSAAGENSDTEDISSDQEADPRAAISVISFGDLVAAQSALGPSRKRKRNQSSPTNPGISEAAPKSGISEHHENDKPNREKQSKRASKEGPREVSSKQPVSWKRNILKAPKIEARDPRFSELSGPLHANQVAQNYAFLRQYRQDEVKELKAKIRGTKDAALQEDLKRELRTLEDREKARKKVDEERAVIRDHRKKEAEAVRQGKKPFFLKKGEIKKQVLVKKFEDLGEKKAEKAMERRRKKTASRQRRAMPSSRREVG